MAIFAFHLVVELFHRAEPHVGLIEHDLWTRRGAGLRLAGCQLLRVGFAGFGGAWCEDEEHNERRQACQKPDPPVLHCGDNRDGQDTEDHLQTAAEADIVQKCICSKEGWWVSIRYNVEKRTTQSKTAPLKKQYAHPPGPYTIRFVWYPVGVMKLALAPIISR